MFGILNLNKPPDWTSRDVVNRVQRLVGRAKAGHAGTLDPLATGVLIVCIGHATRLIQYVQRMPKRYCGTFLMGMSSDTEDTAGRVVPTGDDVRPTVDQLRAVLPSFVGQIQQVPPAYSALKVQGKRAYALARGGQPVDLPARTIMVHQLRLLDYNYPQFTLEIDCGSGTYVRSLGRDIARRLGTEAIMSKLVRTGIGPFRLDEALDPTTLTPENLASKLLSPLIALTELPRITIDPSQQRRLSQGMAIDNRWDVDGPELAAVDADGRLRSIVALHPLQQLIPIKNFP
ncbi:MAG: tRNA pseudouridine(55) synthase TruB [Planctomycetaceae bacterium]|nr:MAG: tRNA pseudouridine(55) synthase TruB [Planctomycetaceae bacterium]